MPHAAAPRTTAASACEPWTHFLTKTLARVRTEMSLHVLAYNLKRVMRILGIGAMLAALRA